MSAPNKPPAVPLRSSAEPAGRPNTSSSKAPPRRRSAIEIEAQMSHGAISMTSVYSPSEDSLSGVHIMTQQHEDIRILMIDPRHQWLEARMISSFRMKRFDYRVAVADDDGRMIVQGFMDSDNELYLFTTYHPSTGCLFSHTPFGPQHKVLSRKVLLFMRTTKEKVVAESINTKVAYMDLYPQPLQRMATVIEHVQAPLIHIYTTREATACSGVKRELLHRLHKLCSAVHVRIGWESNLCNLALPPPAVLKDTRQYLNVRTSRELIHELEGLVQRWSQQCGDVFAVEPSDEDHHGGIDIINFWAHKLTNLTHILQQIHSEMSSKVFSILTFHKSTFSHVIPTLKVDTEKALDHVRRVVAWLQPARPLLECLDDSASRPALYEELAQSRVLDEILHFVYLLWRHSEVYSSTARLTQFLQMIGKDIIRATVAYLRLQDLQEGHGTGSVMTLDVMHRLTKCLELLGDYKFMYFALTTKTQREEEMSRNPRSWRVQHEYVFRQLDAFLERCHDLLHIFETESVLTRVCSIDVGEMHAVDFNAQIRDMNAVFMRHTQAVRELCGTGHVLDFTDEVEVKLGKLAGVVRQIEGALKAILGKITTACTSLAAVFKVLDNFDVFLERPRMTHVRTEHAELVTSLWNKDLRGVMHTYGLCTNRTPPDSYAAHYPPVSAYIYWCYHLLQRAHEPQAKVAQACRGAVSVKSLDAIRILSVFTEKVIASCYALFQDWCQKIPEIIRTKLAQTILSKDELSGDIAVSSDFTFKQVHQEVHLLTWLHENASHLFIKNFEIPTLARSCSQQYPSYRRREIYLQRIANDYNRALNTLPDHEYQLVEQELQRVDGIIEKRAGFIHWSDDHEIDEFIGELQHLMSHIMTAFNTVRSQSDAMTKSLQELSGGGDDFIPFFASRVTDKTLSVEEFSTRYEHHRLQAVAKIADSAKLHHESLQRSLRAVNELKNALGINPIAVTSPQWTSYVSYMSLQVQTKLVDVAFNPIHNLHHQLDSLWLQQNGGIPLLDVKLALSDQKTVCNPLFRMPRGTLSPDLATELTVEAVLRQYIVHSFNQLSHFSHLIDSGGNYLAEVSQAEKLSLVEVIENQIEQMEINVKEFIDVFDAVGAKLFKASHTIDIRSVPSESTSELFIFNSIGSLSISMMSGLKEEEQLFRISARAIDKALHNYTELENAINDLPMSAVIGCLRVDAKPVRQSLKNSAVKMRQGLVQQVHDKVDDTMNSINHQVARILDGIGNDHLEEYTSENLRKVLSYMREVRDHTPRVEAVQEPLASAIALLHRHRAVPPAEIKRLEGMLQLIPPTWEDLVRKANTVREQISNLQDKEAAKLKETALELEERIRQCRHTFLECSLFSSDIDADTAYRHLDQWKGTLDELTGEAEALKKLQDLYEISHVTTKELNQCQEDLRFLKQIWDTSAYVSGVLSVWMEAVFLHVDVTELTNETKQLKAVVAQSPAAVRGWGSFVGLEATIKAVVTTLPLMHDIRSPAVKARHWMELWTTANPSEPYKALDNGFTLSDFFHLKLHNHTQTVGSLVDRAGRELQIERTLAKIFAVWGTKEYSLSGEPLLLGPIDDIIDYVNDHAAILQAIQLNRAVDFFSETVSTWIANLGHVEAITTLWSNVQKQWLSLAPIFQESQDVRTKLRSQYEAFVEANENFRLFQTISKHHTNVVQMCTTNALVIELLQPHQEPKVVAGKMPLEQFFQSLFDVFETCEKGLIAYLEQKRRLFPRFYFLSAVDLLHVLSHSNQPRIVMQHVTKIVEAMESVDFVTEPHESRKAILSAKDKEGEILLFSERSCVCEGIVESWMHTFLDGMRKAVHASTHEAYNSYSETPRYEWMFKFPSQVILVLSRVIWTSETTNAFEALESGSSYALVELLKSLRVQVTSECEFIKRPLSRTDRKMLVALITIDVHSLDVIHEFIEKKVESMNAFQWQSQLKMYWNDTTGCTANICDAVFQHGCEYVGNCGCLVITPLTDRCYITLTQALRLCKGGAAVGPAGTGKTETTKDLARVLGVACFVFNCSEQMDHVSLGGIFKGLAMSGSWGCFDEFNRIPAEVLSVVATQVKCVLEGCRRKGPTFKFEGDELSFNARVGLFITMNPGYLGRTELPENIKALFRPCAMVVPDVAKICEIMLAAEGFLQAKSLAVKFVTLYRLCSEVLSQQEHYDWGLRAIKSVLLLAGKQKQIQKSYVDEKTTLYQALLEASFAKLVRNDQSVFLRIIHTLFLDVKAPDPEVTAFDDAFARSLQELNLLMGEGLFLTKGHQLQELMEVRHSCFVLGHPGGGKSSLWRSTIRAIGLVRGEKTAYEVLEPNAVSSAELYGYTQEVTRDWKDGLLSRIFRDYATASKTKSNLKVIVLDGVIDPDWIESMNTVMDDNKILTLSSNERISLTTSMRLLFEITHLHHATPSTVSRAGILYLNAGDISWTLFKDRWVSGIEDEHERTNLDLLCDKYIPSFLEFSEQFATYVVPMTELSFVQSLLAILDGLRGTGLCPIGSSAEAFEKLFLWACAWAFGSCLSSTGVTDKRLAFTSWFRQNFPLMRLPDAGEQIFDYLLRRYEGTGELELIPWPVPPHQPTDPSEFIQTLDVTRLDFFMSLLVPNGKGVMLVGPSGVGKSATIQRWLSSRLPESFVHQIVPFTAYTDSKRLQTTLEGMLERRSGKQFGPTGRKRLVVFLEDLNLQNPDVYGTQSSLSLLRQHIDYGYWYDMEKLSVKEILQVQYIAAYNPKGGNGFVVDRLQRHFVTFAQHLLSAQDMAVLMNGVMNPSTLLCPPSPSKAGVSQRSNLSKDTSSILASISKATVEVAKMCTKNFPPTADKFHYTFSLREIIAVTRAISELPSTMKPLTVFRVWVHECRSAFSDRFVTQGEVDNFSEALVNVSHSIFAELPYLDDVFREPLLIFRDSDQNVIDARTYDEVHRTVQGYLASYNEANPPMDLVLFNQALQYVLRVRNAIMARPGGHVLCVGVGGSGKRSLSRLAAHSCGIDIFTLHVTSQYTLIDLRQELSALFIRCGVKRTKMAWLLTDAEVVLTAILECMHLFLSTGEIGPFITPQDRDDAEAALEKQLKSQSNPKYSDRSLCWQTFLENVRQNLHVIFCSSAGTALRTWSREFPSLFGSMHCVWFHPWPSQALLTVAERFLTTISLSEEVRHSVARHMSFVFEGVEQHCIAQRVEKMYSYVAPKSFLTYIQGYIELWSSTLDTLRQQKARLALGVSKLTETKENVYKLREALQKEQVAVRDKSANTEVLLEKVGKEKVLVQDQNALAQVERERTWKIVAEVNALVADCEADLVIARPMVKAALQTLNTLDRTALIELKSMTAPPTDVQAVTASVLVLTAPAGKIPRDKSWTACKKMMVDVTRWMKDLQAFNPNTIPQANIDALIKTVRHPSFNPESVATKSVAASVLCEWVTNMVSYHEIRVLVRPKEERLNEAQERLAISTEQQRKVEDKVNDLQDRLDGLVQTYVNALEEKRLLEEQANMTQLKLNLAGRLVESLHEEHSRWQSMILQIDANMSYVTGDTLLTSDVTSYFGPFRSTARENFVNVWREDIKARDIPCREVFDPLLDILIHEAQIAVWFNEGLPRDRFSTENAAITTACKRWPLFIDPQIQASTWIRTHASGHGLVVVHAGDPELHTIVKRSIRAGLPCLIDRLPENPDPSLYTLFSVEPCIHGGTKYFKFGEDLLPFGEKVKLYFQTALPNPHYRPEVYAQLTVINFTVTEYGLTEQLLSTVVKSESPEAEIQRLELIQEMDDMTIELHRCEDSLLLELINAKGDVLENTALIVNLERTKSSSKQISESMRKAKEATETLSKTRTAYRPAAHRGALMYFLMVSLRKVDTMYQYSLESFQSVFASALVRTSVAPETSADNPTAVKDLSLNITEKVYAFVNRGLLSHHKMVFTSLLCLAIVKESSEIITSDHVEFLVRGPSKSTGSEMPQSLSEWLSEKQWNMVQALAELTPFETLPEDLLAHNQWRVWCQGDRPEQERMPTEWKNLGAFYRLLVLRCLCPDRLVIAMEEYICHTLGNYFIKDHSGDLMTCITETSSTMPILFILSSGVDVGKIVEALGARMHYTEENEALIQVSLGQGQESIAERAIETGKKRGAWVFLHNIHLMRTWLPTVDNILAEIAAVEVTLHPNFRIFLSAEPCDYMPIALLQRSMKFANEPPTGVKNNFVRAFQLFSHEPWEQSSKQMEYRTILVALCLFHGLVIERRRFGPLGWNRSYPFSPGDLQVCMDVLFHYLEDRVTVPWLDLRFVFGEIMYGGHITDHWDRRLCNAYLQHMLNPRILEGNDILPNIHASAANEKTTHADILGIMTESFPAESPALFGLSVAADANARTIEGEDLFRQVLIAQPYLSSGDIESGKALLDRVVEVGDSLPDPLPLQEIGDHMDESRTPYQQVFLHECERMNRLLRTMQRDVSDLEAALKGLTPMSSAMQGLADDCLIGKVPTSWIAVGFITCRSLPAFLLLITDAHGQLSTWARDFVVPKVVMLPFFLTPTSFLSAILQDSSQRNGYELDQVMLSCDVTRKLPEGIDHSPRDGCHVYGLTLEGARWDIMGSTLLECRPKDLFTKMPVITIRGQLVSKFDGTEMYECPMYRTTQRGHGYVATLPLRTKEDSLKWILAGVALLLDPTL